MFIICVRRSLLYCAFVHLEVSWDHFWNGLHQDALPGKEEQQLDFAKRRSEDLQCDISEKDLPFAPRLSSSTNSDQSI